MFYRDRRLEHAHQLAVGRSLGVWEKRGHGQCRRRNDDGGNFRCSMRVIGIAHAFLAGWGGGALALQATNPDTAMIADAATVTFLAFGTIAVGAGVPPIVVLAKCPAMAFATVFSLRFDWLASTVLVRHASITVRRVRRRESATKSRPSAESRQRRRRKLAQRVVGWPVSADNRVDSGTQKKLRNETSESGRAALDLSRRAALDSSKRCWFDTSKTPVLRTDVAVERERMSADSRPSRACCR